MAITVNYYKFDTEKVKKVGSVKKRLQNTVKLVGDMYLFIYLVWIERILTSKLGIRSFFYDFDFIHYLILLLLSSTVTRGHVVILSFCKSCALF